MSPADAFLEALLDRLADKVVERLSRQPPKRAGKEGMAECLDPREAAEYLGVAHRTLEGLRWRGKGPPIIKIGRAVRYRRRDLDGWSA